MGGEPAAKERIVWARGSVATTRCPRSEISGESMMYVEAFAAWRLFGGSDYYALPARAADAFAVLEGLRREESARHDR
jgi:hypothetical protein